MPLLSKLKISLRRGKQYTIHITLGEGGGIINNTSEEIKDKYVLIQQ